MFRYLIFAGLALLLPIVAQAAAPRDGHDALSRMWHEMAAAECAPPDYPEGYAEALADCILEVLSPLDQDAVARIDAIIPDMGTQFGACGDKVAEEFG